MLDKSALVQPGPDNHEAEHASPGPAYTHERESLSTTTYNDVGVAAINRQASDLRHAKAMQTDEALFERIARDRSQEAYSEFYDRFSSRIYALLLHMLRAEEDAQDLLQEVFVLVWQKAPMYLESRGNVASWVISLARNRAVDELRSKRYKDKLQETELVTSDDRPEIDQVMIDSKTPDVGLHAQDAKREVHRALRDLTREQRSIVDMAYFGGLTHVEIAQRLEMPVGTVKTKMRQAMMKMGRRLRHRFS